MEKISLVDKTIRYNIRLEDYNVVLGFDVVPFIGKCEGCKLSEYCFGNVACNLNPLELCDNITEIINTDLEDHFDSMDIYINSGARPTQESQEKLLSILGIKKEDNGEFDLL